MAGTVVLVPIHQVVVLAGILAMVVKVVQLPMLTLAVVAVVALIPSAETVLVVVVGVSTLTAKALMVVRRLSIPVVRHLVAEGVLVVILVKTRMGAYTAVVLAHLLG